MGGVHAVARQEVHHDRTRVADARFAEQFGRAEGEEPADSGREGSQGPNLGRELRNGRVVGGNRTTTRRPSSRSATAAS